MSPQVDPQKLARIRARQAYQSRLDAFQAEEERRKAKAKSLTSQIIILPIIIGVLMAVSLATVPMVGWMLLGFGGLTEFVLIFSWFGNSRPRRAPQTPADLDWSQDANEQPA